MDIEKLLNAAEDLRQKLRESRFKMDVKKDFSLMVAESQLGKVIHELRQKQEESNANK